MRVNLQNCVRETGLILWNASPLTGIAYDVQDDGSIASIFNVIAGENVSEHDDWTKGKPRASTASLAISHDGSHYLHHSKPFSGVAYSFSSTGELYEEMEVDYEKTDTLTRRWHSNGHPESYDRYRNVRSWNQDGRLIQVVTPEFSQTLDSEGRCTVLYIAASGQQVLESLLTWRVSCNLILSGNVDDQLLCRLVDLSHLRELTLDSTWISAKGLNAFRQCEELETIYFENRSLFSLHDLEQLADSLPSCEI